MVALSHAYRTYLYQKQILRKEMGIVDVEGELLSFSRPERDEKKTVPGCF